MSHQGPPWRRSPDKVKVRPLRPSEKKKWRRMKRPRTNAGNAPRARILLPAWGGVRSRAIAERLGWMFRGLDGRDRHAVHLVVMTTGFCAGEIAALRPEWFRFDGGVPRVALPASEDKARRNVEQPL